MCIRDRCINTVYWYCVLILCTNTVYWYCVLILCTCTVHWYCVLILCTDTVYWYCVLIPYTDTVYTAKKCKKKALETSGFILFVCIPDIKNEYSTGNMNVLKITKSNRVSHNNENINETWVILTCWCKTLIIHYKNLCFWQSMNTQAWHVFHTNEFAYKTWCFFLWFSISQSKNH